MCAITNEQEGKISPENKALHLSHSVSPKNDDLGETNASEEYSLLRDENVSPSDEGDDQVFLSLSQAGAKSLMDEGESDFNLPAREKHGRALSVGALSVGSISEGRETINNDAVIGDSNNAFCSGILPESVCQGSTLFSEQMDVFMRCQHPMDLLTIFQEDGKGSNGESADYSEPEVHQVSGYHALPRTCEYCGSPNIDLCKDNAECTRPKSYFPRSKPPFYSKGGLKWKEEKKGATIAP